MRNEHAVASSLIAAVCCALVIAFIAFVAGCRDSAAVTAPAPLIEIPTAPPSEATPAIRHVAPRPVPTPASLPPVPASIQQTRWDTAKVKASAQIAVDKRALRFLETRKRYETVEHMRSNGVPAPVIYTLHMRESDCSFTAHLHEGSSLLQRTKYVPKGRPLPPSQPPFTWEQSAEDALYSADHLEGSWADVTWALNKIEAYNGTGYRRQGIPSPYLWAGTNLYVSGKYTEDGHYSKTAIDQQLGCAAVLKRLIERGVDIHFTK